MGLDRDNIPDTYLCEICEPRPFDREGAKALQMRKRTELNIDTSETDSSDEIPDQPKSGSDTGKKGIGLIALNLKACRLMFYKQTFVHRSYSIDK